MNIKNKLIMTIYSTKLGLSYKDRLDIMSHITGEIGNRGFIDKFNNSHGFKDIMWHVDGGSFIEAKISSPKGYLSPCTLLFRNLTFLNKDDEILSFIIPVEKIIHTDNKFSYDTVDIMFKFQKFMYKVLPDIRIEFSFVDGDFVLPFRDYALGYFVTCFAQGECVETEFAGPRLVN